MRLDVGATSDVGQLRTGNEDSFVVDDRLELYAVADGMGGHNAGEVASATAIEALRAAVASGQPLDTAIERANSAVFEKAASDSSMSGMGTTLTAIVIVGESTLLIGHVGDSRAYRIRNGELEQLTEDHSLVEELVREGRLSPEEAEVHPQRSIITRVVGVDPEVDVDLYTLEAQTGDRIILCSDGLTTMLKDDVVLQVAQLDDDPRLAADRLVDTANDAGGEDNITVLIIDVLEAPPPGPPDPEALAAGGTTRTPRPIAAPDVATEAPARKRRPLRTVGGALRYVFPVVVIIGMAIFAIHWYESHTYYVGYDGDRVVVYQGVPGGVLGWKPSVKQRTVLKRSELLADQQAIIDNSGTGGLDKAEHIVANLERAATTTTTTTFPPFEPTPTTPTPTTTAITPTTSP